MPKGAFRYLIKHEIIAEMGRIRQGKWIWFYAVFILLLAGASVAVWGYDENYDPSYFLFTAYMFPFMIFGFAVRTLKREWNGGTSGWWLTLPYSRVLLLGAKAIAAFVQIVACMVVYFAIVMLLGVYSRIMFGARVTSISGLFDLEAQLFAVLLGIVPLMLVIGLLIVAVRRSRMKWLVPLLWIVMGVGGNLSGWMMTGGGGLIIAGTEKELALISYPPSLWIWIVPVWAVAALLFAATVRVCNKHLQA
ncbi:ABC transporter permease [Cohnella terricola]|uniref:Uncharacterized protein n=1 Tax=Cohnella terricola TaxID=1289167 RepID=A0A559JWY8_9BACL|nr:ABC transporter permease [Cohnella terricola]TVY04396.1 hypothetical protein FPZ45_02090 [Cohnella terricola]